MAATTGPGLDCRGTLRVGTTLASKIIFGAETGGLTIDNEMQPPEVRVNQNPLGRGWLFGDGSDGNKILTEDLLEGKPEDRFAEYLQSDMYYENLTIPAGFTLFPQGNRIFVRGTLTLEGIINVLGEDALEDGGGRTGRNFEQSGSGANGGAEGEGGNPGFGIDNSLGGNGGGGGAGGGGEGGGGGIASPIPMSAGGSKVANDVLSMALGRSLDKMLITGGAGGGSGAGSSVGLNDLSGGGGGEGGGVVVICAAKIIGSGRVLANGGNGGNGGIHTGNGYLGCGGGGGGGGGVVIIVTKSFGLPEGSINVDGGAAGTGGIAPAGQLGVGGTAGQPGRSLIFTV